MLDQLVVLNPEPVALLRFETAPLALDRVAVAAGG